jgi:hypothetical protein
MVTRFILEAFYSLPRPSKVAVDDMLIGIAIAPNLSTFANAHESGSTDTVYLDNFFFKTPCLPSQKKLSLNASWYHCARLP